MVTSLKIGGHQNLWTGKMLSIEMAVEVQILVQILQDLQVILQKMILRYSFSYIFKSLDHLVFFLALVNTTFFFVILQIFRKLL